MPLAYAHKHCRCPSYNIIIIQTESNCWSRIHIGRSNLLFVLKSNNLVPKQFQYTYLLILHHLPLKFQLFIKVQSSYNPCKKLMLTDCTLHFSYSFILWQKEVILHTFLLLLLKKKILYLLQFLTF